MYGFRGEYAYGPATIIRWDASGAETEIHAFTDAGAGGSPVQDFVLGSDNLLYGTGHDGFGSVFRFDTAGNVTLLHQFNRTDGAYPVGAMTLGADGAMYGGTLFGTVFSVKPDGTFTSFVPTGAASGADALQTLVLAKNGVLYAPMLSMGVVRVDPATGTVNAFAVPFQGGPVTPLVQGPDCALYGAADVWDPTGTFGLTGIYRIYDEKLCHSIEFAPLPDRTLGGEPFTVSATASSGLPVSFTASGRCRLSGERIVLKRGVGVCRVTAYQDGDSQFQPAADVTHEFRVRPPGRRRSHR
jgi:hypothetical protein